MSLGCNCGGCVSRGLVCVAKGNSKRIVFQVYDQDKEPVDISDATEISFLVAQGVIVAGQVNAGGGQIFEKTLTAGEIIIGGAGDSFSVDIEPEDSSLPAKRLNYYEANVTTASGDVYTVSAGVYQADSTIVGGA